MMTWFWILVFGLGLAIYGLNALTAHFAEDYSKATYFLIWTILFAHFLKESVDDLRKERANG